MQCKFLDDAECVAKDTDYFYYGNRSLTSNETGSQKCENWKEVMKAHDQIFKGYNQFFFPDEYENNSNCRVIKLDKYERIPAENNASAHHYVHTDGWQNGPWCYVKNSGAQETKLWNDRFKTPFSILPCFSLCKGEGQEKK
uniref:Kringle domain-containing protein n=1 Tax=Ditylenchus dipsaci TaxID=166011 RepID=A0A915CVW7_9BILA